MNKEFSTYEWSPRITQERPDGSSDGLYEALDIEVVDPDWNIVKACSNWEYFDKKWQLEEIELNLTEQTAEELVAEFMKNNSLQE